MGKISYEKFQQAESSISLDPNKVFLIQTQDGNDKDLYRKVGSHLPACRQKGEIILLI